MTIIRECKTKLWNSKGGSIAFLVLLSFDVRKCTYVVISFCLKNFCSLTTLTSLALLILLMGIIWYQKSSCSYIVLFVQSSLFFPWRNKVTFRHFLTYIWHSLYRQAPNSSEVAHTAPLHIPMPPPFCIDYNGRICIEKKNILTSLIYYISPGNELVISIGIHTAFPNCTFFWILEYLVCVLLLVWEFTTSCGFFL